MKRITKGILVLAIILLSLFSIRPVFALEEKSTELTKISDEVSLDVGNLSFSRIHFVNNSNTSALNFGLTGVVNNTKDMTYFHYRVDYMAADKTLIKSVSGNMSSWSSNSAVNFLSDSAILSGHSVSDIAYYILTISITEPISNDDIPINMGTNDYYIKKYDVHIKVQEENILSIEETITATFNIPKHGIFRTIPLKNSIVRNDGTTSKNRAKITNLSVNNEYTTSRENGNLKVKIGSPTQTLTGDQTYVIKYDYNLGKDPMKEYDELYYNLIGTEWDTYVSYVSFTIEMPKEFDSSKLGFSHGTQGSTDSSNVNYSVNGTTITGYYDRILGAYNGLTIRCELPEGYFKEVENPFEGIINIIQYIPVLFAGIAYALWHKYGKDDIVVETVEFYPPEGYNSLDVGFLYKGIADGKDVTSLLIYLANKGYLKITELEQKVLFGNKKTFKITKLKPYDGNNQDERTFMDGLKPSHVQTIALFGNSTPKRENENEIFEEDLVNRFYIVSNKIQRNANRKENKNKIFEKTASGKMIFFILMIIAAYCAITIPPLIDSGDIELILPALLFPGIGFTVLFYSLFGPVVGENAAGNIIGKFFGILWGAGFGLVPWVGMMLPILKENSNYLIAYSVGLASILVIVICMKYLKKRTPYGNEVLGKLRGFRNFLQTAEKDKLEAMVNENPTYFYDILPYAYVLGVSDKWIKNFESINITPPDWYEGNSAFNIATFNNFIDNTMGSVQSAMNSSPSDSGGGSSGGGSSGGGSGGGGGGSW